MPEVTRTQHDGRTVVRTVYEDGTIVCTTEPLPIVPTEPKD